MYKKSGHRFGWIALAWSLCVGTGGGLAVSSTSALAQKSTNTVVWGMVASPRHLNPAVQSGINTMEPGAQIFASPLRVDAEWKVHPYLAESFKYEDDNKSLVLKVRKGATFHDGKPITSADFAYSIMSVKAHHPFQAMMAPVERVDTPDADTAIVRLSRAHPPLLLALTSPFTPVLPKHVFDDGTDLKVNPKNSNPVGSGPFKLIEFKPGEHIILEKNKDFFQPAKIDKAIIRIFKDVNSMALAIEAKEVHFTPFLAEISVIDKLATVQGLTVSDKGGHGIGPLLWIAFNTTKKPLDDPRVRQAISFALDREFITKRLHRGRSQVSTGPIAPASPYYSKDVETYKVDLARAEKLLDEAGLKKDAQGIRFKTTITHAPGSRDFSANIAEYAKAQLKRIGIDLEINPAADFPSWAQKVGSHDFDMTIDAVFNWGDPVVGVHRTYLSSNIRKGVVWSNTQSYNNPKVDELLATAAVEPDEVKRKQLYAEFQRIVVADAPQAFLTVIPYYTVTVAGLKGIPTDIWSATSPIDMLEWE